jgi:ABC-2 type transport system permease protein
MRRLRALIRKELLDAARNRGALVPVAVAAVLFLALPVTIAVIIPSASGHPLSEDADLVNASTAFLASGLTVEARVQVFVFEQFLLLFLLLPITGAMALAAHAIVGEKQARTLEPLLATPLTTPELLVAKVVGALVPTLAISFLGLALYGGIVAAIAQPGVLAAMLGARTLTLTLLVGPAAALVALQLAIVISSRVNDPRTAQQFGVIIVLPLTAVLIAQFTGSTWLSTGMLGAIALGLVGAWLALLAVSVVLFDREQILTRWR